MILDALRLANFKAFGAAQRVPLRPITLIFGANSAGKSSLLHALALAHHAIETGELDTQRTQIGGESIDLGGFHQYVHRRQREQQVELAFELDAGRVSGRVAELLRTARGAVVELGIGGGFTSEDLTLFGDAPRKLDRDGGVRVERFAIEVDGVPLLSMSARRDGRLRLDRLNHAHPVFREVFRGILTLATTTLEVREDDFASLANVLDGLVPGITARRQGLFPRIEEDVEGGEVDAEPGLLAVSRGRRQEDLAQAARIFLPRVLRELVGGLSAAIEGEIRRLFYLGPLRSYPPRHLAFAAHHDPNWQAGGGAAWDVLRRDREVREVVNRWLSAEERLSTPYEVVVRDLLAFDQLDGPLYEAIQAIQDSDGLDIEPDYDDEPTPTGAYPVIKDVDEQVENFKRVLHEADIDRFTELVLLDRRTNTMVSHRDVGIGVSQALPVLVNAYARKGSLVAIEQPEIHLHPALQSELGDVFLESALGSRRNVFLLETHSEHLLLRVMRRMRETSDGTLPDGMQPVRPEDVMVLFVEPDGAQSLVRQMPLNERGELVKAWPGGFFEEGLREIF